MRNLLQRLLDNILDGISAFFNLGVRLKYVVALLILFTGGAVALTYNRMLNNVGGRSDYEEAMRYIAMKDLITECSTTSAAGLIMRRQCDTLP